MLSRRTNPLPVECVARGYLSGSGWKDYQATGALCGITLPKGMRESDRLPEVLFTPATKADSGHDENISEAAAAKVVGTALMTRLKKLTLELYAHGVAHAESKGIILADTKFEFGLVDGRIILIDEVMTPDSSRFWPAAGHQAGQEPPSWDKQILRNHLETLDWDHAPPPPRLPAEILAKTSQRYREVLDILFPEEAAAWRKYL